MFHFSGNFSAFNFWLGNGEISIENKNTNIVGDCKVSVLWHRMKKCSEFLQTLNKH